MTTSVEAYAVLRARLASGLDIPIRWQGEDADNQGNVDIPNVPAAFAYAEFYVDPAEAIGVGGGRFKNVYRNPARFEVYIFVPRGWGLPPALEYAEQVAALFRSYRDTDISCFDCTVFAGGDGTSLTPPGLSSEVGNYYYSVAAANLWFDQVG